MKKKGLLAFLLLCSGCLTLASCEMLTPKNPDSGDEIVVTSQIALNKESVELEPFQEFWLTVSYTGEGTVVWAVEDPTIVSVENGKLVGLKAGTTTVTASVGSETDTCSVTVSALKEEKLSLDIAESNISIYKDEEKQISATLSYDGTVRDLATQKSYQSSNTDVVSVDSDGKLTANAYGSATITVVYVINGIELANSLNVDVISSGALYVERNFVDLDVSDTNKTATLIATATEKGVENANAEIIWTATDGQDVILLNGNEITALNAGKTVVTATYVDSEGQVRTEEVTVTVSPINVDSEESLLLYKNLIEDGYAIDLEELVGDESDLVGGYVTFNGLTINLPYADGKFDLSSLSAGNMELYLQTRNIVYKAELELWTARISDASDLELLLTAKSGWYKLDADIDCSDIAWKYAAETEFNGTLDGGNKTISGLTTNSGLFNVLTDEATIKNVTVYATVKGGGALATKVSAGANVQVENVSIYVDVWNQTAGGIFGSVEGNVNLKDVDGLVSGGANSKDSGALFGAAYVIPQFENVSVYSSLSLCGTWTEGSSKSSALNELTGIIVSPTLSAEKRILDVEKAGTVSVELNAGSYVSYVIYGNEIRETSASNGTVAIKAKDVADRFGGTVDVLLETADGTTDYYAIPLSSIVYLGQSNVAKYLNVEGTITGEYVLTENIDLGGTYLSNQATFSGVLDGNGYIIQGVNVAASAKGGLFGKLNGTVKNLTLIGSVSKNGGILADTLMKNGSSTIENVYVEASLSGGENKGGLVRIIMQGHVATLNNVVVNVTSTTENEGAFFGMIASVEGNPVTLTLTNCYYIATAINPISNRADDDSYYVAADQETILGEATTDGNVVTFANGLTGYVDYKVDETTTKGIDAFNAALTAETITLPSVVQDMIANAQLPVEIGAIYLRQDNFAEYLNVEGTITGEYVLTEDIDLDNTYLSNQATFSGVLDGNGYTIKGIEVNNADSSKGGLFSYLNGTVKNITLIGSVYTEGGLLANVLMKNGSSTLENVYVIVELSGGADRGGLVRDAWQGHEATWNNVVVNATAMTGEEGAYFGMIATKDTNPVTLTLTNCYYIATTAVNPISNRTNSDDKYVAEDQEEILGTKTTNGNVATFANDTCLLTGYVGDSAKSEFDAAVTNGTVELSEELKKMMGYSTNA